MPSMQRHWPKSTTPKHPSNNSINTLYKVGATMRHGKLVTEEANIAKTQRETNARLWNSMQEAKANGDYCETVEELKTLTLEEVTKRLREIKGINKGFSDWTDLDNVRWPRLAWRAKQLGVSNPFTLTKNQEAN